MLPPTSKNSRLKQGGFYLLAGLRVDVSVRNNSNVR